MYPTLVGSASSSTRVVTTARRVGQTTQRRRIESLVRPATVADYQMIANQDIVYGSAATTRGKIYAGRDAGGTNHNVDHQGTAYDDVYAEGQVTGPATWGDTTKVALDSNSSPTIRSKVPAPINFATFTSSLTDLAGAATLNGLPTLNDATVGAYRLTFNGAGTVSIARCTYGGNGTTTAPTCATTGLGTGTFNVPSNGAIYASRDVIVMGVVKGKVTLGVGNAKNIWIGGNLDYTSSSDVLGLIAANEMIVAMWCPNNLDWRAATIAQGGTSGNGQWRSETGSPIKGTMNFTGSTATAGGGYMSMFGTRNYLYDTNLAAVSPPFFPILEAPYVISSCELPAGWLRETGRRTARSRRYAEAMLRFLTAGEIAWSRPGRHRRGVAGRARADGRADPGRAERRRLGFGAGRACASSRTRSRSWAASATAAPSARRSPSRSPTPSGPSGKRRCHPRRAGRPSPLTQPRPGHADLAGMQKYGFDDARDVLERARVGPRPVSPRQRAKRCWRRWACRSSARGAARPRARPSGQKRPTPADLETVDASEVRCFDPDAEADMIREVKAAAKDGDSLGGVVEVLAYGVPVGLGSHVHWDRKLDASLARALMSIQAVKGVELGDGFDVAGRRGSEAHDPISWDGGDRLRAETDGRVG